MKTEKQIEQAIVNLMRKIAKLESLGINYKNQKWQSTSVAIATLCWVKDEYLDSISKDMLADLEYSVDIN
jgi:hypothetical protein